MPNVTNTDEITQGVNSGNTSNSNDNQQNQAQNTSKQVVLGCDRNGNDDSNYQSTVAGIIEQAGYTVEKLAIEPNAFASYSYDSSKAKGKIGIYLIAAGTYSIGDATYGNTSFDYNYFGIRPECSPNWEVEDFDTKPIGSDADTRGGVTDKIAGKTFKEINDIVKERSMVVTGKDATEMGNNLVAAMGGQAQGGQSATGGGAVSIPDKTFYGLIKQIMGAVDAVFIIANNMAYLLSFKDVYEYRNQFDEFIPIIETKDVLRDSLVKNWSTDGYYNAVEVSYADGIIKYQNDVLVKQYGENAFYYEFPEDDEETAKAKADALLAAHIRDYSTNIQLSVFYNENITEGSWVKVNKTLTQISGKTLREIEQDKLKEKGNKISTKHKGVTIENLIEKTITQDDITKTIQTITDEEGNVFDIEIDKSEYELFFVQSYTCRWDEHNSLIMDLELKYGPDTPDDPINATIGVGGVSSGGGAVGGQAADINAFVQQCLGSSAKQDRATAEKLYKCLQGLIVYSYYDCSHYTTASECYQHAKELNCADTSRLVTACYKAAGFQCQVVWGPGHFWNELQVGSETITIDLSSGKTGVAPSKAMGDKISAGGSAQQREGDNPHC